MTCAAVLVAAGSGSRLGADVPKAFVPLAGRTLLEHAVARFVSHPDVDRVVVVAPADRVDDAARLAGVPAVAGGDTRQRSVGAGLAAVGDARLVLVHDVARAFVPTAVIAAVVAALRAGAVAAIPVLAVHDTIRRVDAAGELVEVVDRASLVAVQTPQGFRRDVLAAAHEAGRGRSATDDAALVEALGHTVVAVPGAEEAFKITRPWDLAVAEAVAARVHPAAT
ncbi:2-C-methyl-D-erythritol 4-phosphate cytidylyltransferase [Jatrophihabitans endophyticus]|uniref:2-C-methyl-D-erythritol 4-phosphate cytidylyltransferase n=1 Tax=Jatrophihabitans endophyticus TaxID=1206085 RepID=A0A1M5R9J0_9ACTN|nr:2-C-methyl-D-erythritol 4-phosphate cytidylyltransferase [Jatrophihabitans endophyticus]SHH22686.1 2-C-methyl-D-erythritol 4-phosphate cytidylyltransferase [Jatrophihabitans endophyticus]